MGPQYGQEAGNDRIAFGSPEDDTRDTAFIFAYCFGSRHHLIPGRRLAETVLLQQIFTIGEQFDVTNEGNRIIRTCSNGIS